MYTFYLDDTALPVTPAKVQFKKNSRNKTIDLINTGEVSILKGRGLTAVEFEAEFPQQNYPFAVYENGFLPAEYYLLKLDELKAKKKPFSFKIIRTSPGGEKLYQSEMLDVSLEEWSVTEDAGNGTDVSVKISLKEYRNYGAKILNPVKSTEVPDAGTKNAVPAVQVIQQRKSDKDIPSSHTVKPGDTLWLICKKELGDGAKYKDIAKLNGIKNPNVIKPGQVIRFG